MNRSVLYCIVVAFAAVNSVSSDEQPASKDPKPVEIKGTWGPKLGPDGKIKSLPTAVIPKRINEIMLKDFESRLGTDLPAAAKRQLLDTIKKRVTGDGPSAWFNRRLNKDEDDDVQISNPQTSEKRQLMGGKKQGFEIGTWQPPLATPAMAIQDGYRWKLEWRTQLGFGEVRRGYRVDVDLTAKVDIQSADVTYNAVWTGPFVVDPLDFEKLQKPKEADLKKIPS